MKSTEKTEIKLPLTWALDQPAPSASNLVHIQKTPTQEVVLTFGYGVPMLFGEPEQQQKQLQSLKATGLAVQTVARVSLSADAALKLRDALSEQLES